MALPLLNTQTFELNVPSTDEKIKYRPFLVKEEKILLQAQEGDDTEMIDALMTIIENCTFGKIQPHKYPSFDMEYIFLKIRSKAVGEKVSLNLTCPDDNETKVQHTVDLSTLENKDIDYTLLEDKKNEFAFKLPHTDNTVTFKVLTHGDEKNIDREIEGLKKINKDNVAEVTTRLKYIITSVNGMTEKKDIREFVDKYLLAKDARALREY